MNLRPLVVLFMIGCGDNSATSTAACTTIFSGNLAAKVESPDACATLGADGGFGVSVTASASGTTLMVSIELGMSPSATTYTSETVTDWAALAERTTSDGGGCVYAAGTQAVPTSSFTLVLADASDTPHGDLQLVQYVQAQPQTDCGPGDTEMVDITF